VKLLFEITIDFIALMMATALAMTIGRNRDNFVVTVLNTMSCRYVHLAWCKL
jgi:hypothetical protein